MQRATQTAPEALSDLQNRLLALNTRITLRALKAALGDWSENSDIDLYHGFENLLDKTSLGKFSPLNSGSKEEKRTYHTLLSHYLQFQAMPYENELSQWARGASAAVDGEKVYLREIHTWCQKNSDVPRRLIMEKETSSISKFLKPFALAPWNAVLEILEEELGYPDYVAYCADKKSLDYGRYSHWVETLMDETADLYFNAMDQWVKDALGLPLSQSNRFDAIYLVGLGQFDPLFPSHIGISDLMRVFQSWGIELESISGLHLHLEPSSRKGHQGLTFALHIPGEVHVVMNPSGGWIDFETLFHEMGHALGIVHTHPGLAPALKDFNTSSTLSETYAFLIQNMCFTPPFLERILRLKPHEIDTLLHYKALKDLAFFRRYAAKFLSEMKMFQSRDPADGRFYADLLKHYTGFSYKPETHLFDLAPELYALDYVISWTAEANLQHHLSRCLGDEWMFKREAGDILKSWWAQGNAYEIDEFFHVNGLGAVQAQDIVSRWRSRIR